MDFDLNQNERLLLRSIGQTGNGAAFVHLLEKLKNDMSSVDSIPPGSTDYGAQVEGRRLFKEFIKELTRCMTINAIKKGPRVDGNDDFT